MRSLKGLIMSLGGQGDLVCGDVGTSTITPKLKNIYEKNMFARKCTRR